MSKNNSSLSVNLKIFFNNITLGGLKDSKNLELLRRIRLLHLLAITAVIILTIMSIVVFIEGKPYLSLINMSGALIFFILRQYLIKTGNFSKASLGGLILSFIFLLYFFVSGGNNNTGHVWSFLFPILASFLLGAKRGFSISFIYILISIISGFFFFQFQSTYPMEFRIRFAMSLFSLSLLSFYIGVISEDTTKKLTNTNMHLKKVVEGLKQTELQLIEAKENAEEINKAKSEFLRNMSHELRTPLNHIIGFSQLILDGIPGSINDTQKEYLGDVLDSSSHLLSLINDLLDLSRIESGKLDISREQIDLKEIITQTLEMFKTKIDKKQAGFRLNLGKLPDTIMADKRKIIQILYNLLSNAVKFTNDNGIILVSAKTAENHNEIIVRIKDSGIGLEEKNMNLIFDSFGQVESDVTRKYEGTGLGLSLTKNLVELHGGRIWVESEGLGMGSIFSFTLPI